MLSIKNLSVRIRGHLTLDGVSLEVHEGEVVGLLGPNGAGKTTCFRAILGQIPLQKGSISLDGEDLTGLPMHRLARKGIGYLPQEASVFRGLTVFENLMGVLQLRPGMRRKERLALAESLLAALQITRLRRARGGHLSGGERRRVELARALAAAPRHILLDEPFAGVDPVSIAEIQRLVRDLTSRGIGVLVTDHNVHDALGLCDRAYVLHSGMIIAAGTPAEIVGDERVRGVYLGTDFELRERAKTAGNAGVFGETPSSAAPSPKKSEFS